jgi:hypothetical protein
MGDFNIKVTEYGIMKKNNEIYPEHYNWDYCVKKKIPYIIVNPQIKYSDIEYDLLPVDDGISFKKEDMLSDFFKNFYDKYITESNLPKNGIKLIGGNRTMLFEIFKKDQNNIIAIVMLKLEEYINKYGIIDPEIKEYYKYTREANKKNKKREEFLKQQGLL